VTVERMGCPAVTVVAALVSQKSAQIGLRDNDRWKTDYSFTYVSIQKVSLSYLHLITAITNRCF
jgi:hypothetical protein